MRTLLNSWSVITHSLHESLNRIHQNTAPKFISLILTFLFITQFPLMAMADHTNEPVIPVSDEDFLYYHHDDHLGSSHVLTEGKDKGYHSGVTYNKGDLLQRFEYEPFGREKYVLNPNLNIDPSYTGQTYDVESGLYYYHARYYDPTLARFIQPDTIVPDAKNLQAFNRYSYVVNNPFKYTDPSGHGALDWFKKIFGAIVGVLAGIFIPPALGLAGLAAATVGGAIGGAISGAISGGWRGFLLGGILGGLGGFVFGGIAGHLQNTFDLSNFATTAIMGGIGSGLAYGVGGWRGLVTFGAGFGVGVGIKGIRGDFAPRKMGGYNKEGGIYSRNAGKLTYGQKLAMFEQSRQHLLDTIQDNQGAKDYFREFGVDIEKVLSHTVTGPRIYLGGGSDNLGRYNPVTNNIRIHDNAFDSVDKLSHTYIHELGHWANDIATPIGNLNPSIVGNYPGYLPRDPTDGPYGELAEQTSLGSIY